MRAAPAALVALVAACGQGGAPPPKEKGAARDPLLDVALPAGATRVAGNQFHVDAAAQPGCTAGADCVVLADLHAADGYKVNTDYPFKFVPAAGALAPAARFAPTGVHTGRLILRFRRDGAEAVRVAGDLKLSVCNADQCIIEAAPIAVAIP